MQPDAGASPISVQKGFDAESTVPDLEAELIDDSSKGVVPSDKVDTIKALVAIPRINTFFRDAENFMDLTPRRADRFKTLHLDPSTLHVSDDLIGCSGTSQVFRGLLRGRPVAVKRLRMDVISRDCSKKDLKDLLTEIDFMCRLILFVLRLC